MSKYIRYIFYLAIVILSVVEVSCKKKTPENIGMPLLPGSDLLNAQFTDTLTLVAHTVKDDSVRTDEVNPIFLGNLNDPLFGITKASVFTQFVPHQTNPSFGTNPQIDSAVLSLVYTMSNGKGQYYGNLTPQKFEVYELLEKMNVDSIYYSNKQIPIITTQQIGVATLTPDVEDSVWVDTLHYPPHLRIKLSKEFFSGFLTSSYYSSNSNFQNVFKGIYLKSTTIPSSGQGAILYLNLTHADSRLTLFYHNDASDSLYYYFGITNDGCARFSHFDHDYSSAADISNQLNTSYSIQENYVYVQPMGGVRTKITFPAIKTMFGNHKVAINKAELILPVESSSVDSVFTAHSKLVATIADSAKGPLILPDYYEGASYFGGNYDAVKKEYSFNIARYIQQVMNGTKENNGLYIIANSRPTTANRVQLFGGSQSNANRMKLKITYTPVE